MENSLSNFELTDSTVKLGTDSESGSDKSEAIEIVGYSDIEADQAASKVAIDNFDDHLPATVTLLNHKESGAKVYLIGTAHYSKESQADVELVIRNVQPHIVVVELCSSRTSILSLDEETILKEAKNIDMAKIRATIQSNGLVNGMLYLLMLSMSAHITKELGMAPGGEFRVAYKEAEKIPNCLVHLGDRPLGITMRRALSNLTWFQSFKLAWNFLTTRDHISAEEIEKFKDHDLLEQLLADLAGEYPSLRRVFLDERDIYLTSSLQSATKIKTNEQIRIVGVVGMGHVPGIIRLWPHEQRQFVPAILTVPPPSLTSRVVRLSIRIVFLGLGGYVVYKYVPLPKVLRRNVGGLVEKLFNGIKNSPGIKYTTLNN